LDGGLLWARVLGLPAFLSEVLVRRRVGLLEWGLLRVRPVRNSSCLSGFSVEGFTLLWVADLAELALELWRVLILIFFLWRG
jgi:hypothetical protein